MDGWLADKVGTEICLKGLDSFPSAQSVLQSHASILQRENVLNSCGDNLFIVYNFWYVIIIEKKTNNDQKKYFFHPL